MMMMMMKWKKMDHVRRKILQDSTLLSVSSSASEEVIEEDADLEDNQHKIPAVVIHEATLPVSDSEESHRPESPIEIPASPASQYYTAPSSRRHTSLGSAPSPTFDTTAEEMALFEMFGEDYDDVVAAMSHQERVELGEKITNRSEEEMKLVAEKLKKIIQKARPSLGSSSITAILEEDQRLSIGSDISPFSLGSAGTISPSPVFLPDATTDEIKESEPFSKCSPFAPPDKKLHLSFEEKNHVGQLTTPIFNPPNNLSFNVESSQIENEEDVSEIEDEKQDGIDATPIFNQLGIDEDEKNIDVEVCTDDDDRNSEPKNFLQTGFTNNFMIPTASSLHMMVKSPSPRKPLTNPIWLPPSPSPSKLSIGRVNSHSAALKSPISSSKRLAPQSRLPQLIRTPQNNRSALTEVGNSGARTPSSLRKVDSVKAAYAAVASPVATFVKNNPAPHLVENIKAKVMADPLESTLVEVERRKIMPDFPCFHLVLSRVQFTKQVRHKMMTKPMRRLIIMNMLRRPMEQSHIPPR